MKFNKQGDGNCGKTSLLYAFKMKKFLEEHTPTIVETYVDAVYVDATKVILILFLLENLAVTIHRSFIPG